MKKFICIIICIALLVGAFIVYIDYHKSFVEYPLTEINTTYDNNGNLIQQIIYNESTKEYLLKEYSYKYENKKWVCVNQTTTILREDSTLNYNSQSLKIHYNKELTNGPIVLMDNADVKVSIVKYLASDFWWDVGYELKIENKSNKILTCTIDDTYIMNTYCQPLFSIEHVEAKHTEYFIIGWDRESLDRNHIPYVDNVEFMVRVFNNEYWNNRWTDNALWGTHVLLKQ